MMRSNCMTQQLKVDYLVKEMENYRQKKPVEIFPVVLPLSPQIKTFEKKKFV